VAPSSHRSGTTHLSAAVVPTSRKNGETWAPQWRGFYFLNSKAGVQFPRSPDPNLYRDPIGDNRFTTEQCFGNWTPLIRSFIFLGMAPLILVTVVVGFADLFFASVFRLPRPNLLVHIHGAAFSCWIVLLITRNLLVPAGRV
jgi:hypothetical protein